MGANGLARAANVVVSRLGTNSGVINWRGALAQFGARMDVLLLTREREREKRERPEQTPPVSTASSEEHPPKKTSLCWTDCCLERGHRRGRSVWLSARSGGQFTASRKEAQEQERCGGNYGRAPLPDRLSPLSGGGEEEIDWLLLNTALVEQYPRGGVCWTRARHRGGRGPLFHESFQTRGSSLL